MPPRRHPIQVETLNTADISPLSFRSKVEFLVKRAPTIFTASLRFAKFLRRVRVAYVERPLLGLPSPRFWRD